MGDFPNQIRVQPRTGRENADLPPYDEFTSALVAVLEENEVGPADRTKLFKARTRLKSHPALTDAGYRAAVDAAFETYEHRRAGRR